MAILTLSRPMRQLRGDQIRVTSVGSDGSEVWFQIQSQHEELLSHDSDYLLLAMLLPAMAQTLDLHIGGSVSDELLYNANNDLQEALGAALSTRVRVRVSSDATHSPRAQAAGVSTEFSGGVDSMAVVREFAMESWCPPALRLTHLLNFDVGSHGRNGARLREARLARLQPFAAELGLPLVQVDSNLDSHYDRMGFAETFTLRNAAAVHLLQRGIGLHHHAAAHSFAQWRSSDLASTVAIEPALLPLLSTSHLSIRWSSAAETRVEKTIGLIGRAEAKYLDVCISDAPSINANCSTCAKCVRTLLTLEIAGALESFTPQPFDRDCYEAALVRQLPVILASDEPIEREILAFASSRDWHPSLTSRARALDLRIRNALRRERRRVGKLLRTHYPSMARRLRPRR